MTTGDDYESDYRLSRLEGSADGLVTGDQLKSILCSQLPSFTTTSSATFRIYNRISDHFNTAPLKQYNTSTDDPISVEDNGSSLEPPLSAISHIYLVQSHDNLQWHNRAVSKYVFQWK